ncbi:MAG: hypothetical protein ACYC05_10255 [Sulfuricella sp.]
MSAFCPVSMLPGCGKGGKPAAFVIAALVVLALYAKGKQPAPNQSKM